MWLLCYCWQEVRLIFYINVFSSDDIIRAVDKLKVLGNGFELIALGSGRFLVQSVPGELNMDDSRVLQLAEDAAYVTKVFLFVFKNSKSEVLFFARTTHHWILFSSTTV